MSDIAIIGDRESVLGFRAIGFDVYGTDDTDIARSTLRKLVSDNVPIIFITEQLALALQPEIQKYQAQISPAIIPIPGASGSRNTGLELIRSLVEKATGMDLFKERNEVAP